MTFTFEQAASAWKFGLTTLTRCRQLTRKVIQKEVLREKAGHVLQNLNLSCICSCRIRHFCFHCHLSYSISQLHCFIFFLIVLINVTLSSFSSNNLSVYIWGKFKGLEKSLNSTLQKCAAERQGRVRAQQVGSVFVSNH